MVSESKESEMRERAFGNHLEMLIKMTIKDKAEECLREEWKGERGKSASTGEMESLERILSTLEEHKLNHPNNAGDKLNSTQLNSIQIPNESKEIFEF